MRILIIRLSAIGDTIHTLPVADYLKWAIPRCEIGWIVEPASAPLLIGNPVVDKVFTLDKRKWTNQLRRPSAWGATAYEAAQFFKSIRAWAPAAALDAQGLAKSAVCGYFSGAPVRVGWASAREGAAAFYTDCCPGDYFDISKHVVEANLSLARYLRDLLVGSTTSGEPLAELAPPYIGTGSGLEAPPPAGLSGTERSAGGVELATGSGALPAGVTPPLAAASRGSLLPSYIRRDYGAEGTPYIITAPPAVASLRFPLPEPPAESRQRAAALLTLMPNSLSVALIPGTTWETKIWPEEKWVGLGSLILGSYGAQLLLIGAKDEKPVNSRIASEIKSKFPDASVLDLTGDTSFPDLIALFAKTDLVVGGDTGPLHLAAAVGIPAIVGIFGSTPWTRNGPYGAQCAVARANLWCQPCFSKKCPLGSTACLRQFPAGEVFGLVSDALNRLPKRQITR